MRIMPKWYEVLLSTTILALTIFLFVVYPYTMVGYLPLIVILSSTVAFSSVSVLVGLRKLFFLAGATSHISLAALLIAIIIIGKLTTKVEYILMIAVIICTGLTSIVGYLIRKGTDKDTATAVIVSLSASISVVLAYIIKDHYGHVIIDVESLIWGDPLLVSQTDAMMSISIAIISLVITLLTYKAHALIGIDYDVARTSGINVRIYDMLLYVLIGVTLSALLKIVGFILEHVLVLMPSSIALSVVSGTKKMVFVTFYVSLLASLAGVSLSIALDLSPSGTIGIIFGFFYLVALWRRKVTR